MTHNIEPRPPRRARRVAALLFAAAPAAAFVAFAGPAAHPPPSTDPWTVIAGGDPCQITIESPGVPKAPNCAGD